MVAVPREIKLTDACRRLDVIWEDGTASRLSAATLRTHSRGADALRAGIDDVPPALPDDLSIARVLPIGGYAVNLVFSDGHRRGIYPWPYLRALAEGAAARVGAPGSKGALDG